jgi:hypothetical protein
LTVGEPWTDDYKDKSSADFKVLAGTLKKGIEELYDDKNTEKTSIMARLVEIR